MRPTLLIISAAIFSLLTPTAWGQLTDADIRREKAAVEKLLRDHTSAIQNNDLDKIMDGYASTGNVFQATEGGMFSGRDEIRKRWEKHIEANRKATEGGFKMVYQVPRFKIQIENENLAFATFTGKVQVSGPDMQTSVKISGSKAMANTADGWRIIQSTDTQNLGDLLQMAASIARAMTQTAAP